MVTGLGLERSTRDAPLLMARRLQNGTNGTNGTVDPTPATHRNLEATDGRGASVPDTCGATPRC